MPRGWESRLSVERRDFHCSHKGQGLRSSIGKNRGEPPEGGGGRAGSPDARAMECGEHRAYGALLRGTPCSFPPIRRLLRLPWLPWLREKWRALVSFRD